MLSGRWVSTEGVSGWLSVGVGVPHAGVRDRMPTDHARGPMTELTWYDVAGHVMGTRHALICARGCLLVRRHAHRDAELTIVSKS